MKAMSCYLVGIITLIGALSFVRPAESQATKPSVKKEAAGRYRLVKGDGYTVCEAFLKNLNAFPASEPPMVCEQKIHPKHPAFTKPQWEEMDVQSNLNIVYAAEMQIVILYGRAGVTKPTYSQWLESFQNRIKMGEAKPRLMKTVMALNSRGPETLIAYQPVDGECLSSIAESNEVGNGGSGNYVFALRSGSESSLEPVPDSWAKRSILVYQHKPYFLWSASVNSEIWSVRLYAVSPVTPEKSGMNGYFLQQRCEFQVSKVTHE